jgi:hypothetical protein
MKNIQFVTSDKLENLEQYGVSFVVGMITIQTLESFHIVALRKGILSDEEAEIVQTICWELRRLMALYKTCMEKILDRTDIDEEDILSHLKTMVPEIKTNRKKK